MPARVFTEQEIESIRQRYASGEAIKSIAKDLHTCAKKVSALIPNKRTPRETTLLCVEVNRLYQDGYTIKQIASELHTHQGKVSALIESKRSVHQTEQAVLDAAKKFSFLDEIAAAANIGINTARIYLVRNDIKYKTRKGIKVTCWGKEFDSIKAVAKDPRCEVSLCQLRKHLADGEDISQAVLHREPKLGGAKEVTYQGKPYKSITELARHLNVDVGHLATCIRKGRDESTWSNQKKLAGITYKGQHFKSVPELAKHLGMGKERLANRIKSGLPEEQWADREGFEGRQRGTAGEVEYNGVIYPSYKALAEAHGLNYKLLHRRVKQGLPKEEWLKLPRPLTAQSKSLQLLADLAELVQDLGEHLHELPQKAWLRIIKQATADIGPQSKLQPIRVKLLKGEIKPEDILPPAPEHQQEDDNTPTAPPAVSKLQEEINRLLEGDDGSEEIDSDDSIDDGVVEEVIDIQDDDDEHRAALIRLTPQRVLDQMSAVASVTTDEAALEAIRHDAVERLWTRVFLSNDQLAEVTAIRAAKPADRWAELLRDSFLQDWQLIETIGEIPGFVAADGFRLNLMQRREAALLRRDRHRLNISGMGAGKTLAAIAGVHLCGARRVLVLAPNSALSAWQRELSEHFPDTAIASKTWTPHWMPSDQPRWLLNNHEMLGDYTAKQLAVFIEAQEPDAVIIDELHLCKMRDETTESQRHRNLKTLCDQLRDSAILLGLTGTPVVNELAEAVGLIRLIRPDLAKDLKVSHTIDNCLDVHEALQPICSRYVPPLPCKVTEHHLEARADHLYEEVLEACGKNPSAVDAVLVQAKLKQLVEICQRPGKTVVFTSAVAGVVDAARDALTAAGIRTVVHTGQEKETAGIPSLDLFLQDQSVQVLIASTGTLATGFDGLQAVCSRLCYLTLPWTPAEYDQSKHRVIRQGSTADEIELFTISAVLFDEQSDEDWSYDSQKVGVLTGKRTVMDAVTDGVIPDQAALKFSLTEARRAHRKLLKRVKEVA